MVTATASRPRQSSVFRQQGFAPRSIDLAARTVEAFVTTEQAVREYDYDRGEIVPRVLLTSGAQWPDNGQIPLLDAHERGSVGHILGSARGLTRQSDGVVGTLHFSSVAEEAWSMVREGHATDVSAGFVVLAETYIDDGERETIGGRSFVGPINVATKWKLFEVSLVPIGADSAAKLRGASGVTSRTSREFLVNSMDRLMRAFNLASRGDSSDCREVAQRMRDYAIWLDRLANHQDGIDDSLSDVRVDGLTVDEIDMISAFDEELRARGEQTA